MPLNNRNFDDSPQALRDRVLGRVTGRALAHEIGHFLLRSSGHSRERTDAAEARRAAARRTGAAALRPVPRRCRRFLSTFATSMP